MNNWFIKIEEKPYSGSWNMAVDEFLFNEVQKEEKTILRFYEWEIPTLSIGFSQRVNRILNMEYLEKNRVPFVRRITGGKVVFHNDEITYSISSSEKIFFEKKSLSEAYTMISGALIEGLKKLSIKAELSGRSPKFLSKSDLPCFSFSSKDEILVNGKKIVGSAQKRKENCLIQHGSIPISVKREEIANLTYSDKEILEEKMTTIGEILNRDVDKIELIEAFKRGFEKYFEVKVIDYKEPSYFFELVEKLNIKYKSKEWNYLF
ncbi:MAG: lipoate--protein ligase family protein [Acidobacteriota bacterium]